MLERQILKKKLKVWVYKRDVVASSHFIQISEGEDELSIESQGDKATVNPGITIKS